MFSTLIASIAQPLVESAVCPRKPVEDWGAKRRQRERLFESMKVQSEERQLEKFVKDQQAGAFATQGNVPPGMERRAAALRAAEASEARRTDGPGANESSDDWFK